MKKQIKQIFRIFGLDIHRITPANNKYLQLLKGLDTFGINLIFDIGANIGQFASELRSVGYTGRIVSFEPLSIAHEELIARSRKDSDWIAHNRCAIGDTDGEIGVNIARNSVSSSILPMLGTHSSTAPDSAYVRSEAAPIHCLDTVAGPYLSASDIPFIKIDTQGYEWHVLNGAAETLKKARGVECELSLVELYEGQPLLKEMINRLEREGFTMWAVHRGFTDPRNGQTLQVDAVFFRLGN